MPTPQKGHGGQGPSQAKSDTKREPMDEKKQREAKPGKNPGKK